MLDELNLLESKLNKLIETMEVLKKENDELKPNLHSCQRREPGFKNKNERCNIKS